MSNYLFINQDKSSELLTPVVPVDYNLHPLNDRLIYVPLATRNSFGVIKVGDGLEIEHGVLRVVGGGGSSDITKLSQLENDVGFITNDVDDLHHYYDIDAINGKFEDVMTLSDIQIVSGIKIFTETIGLLNTDGTLDRIRHINNNFLIVDQNGTALLDIDEGFKTIKSFGKELAFVEDIPNLSDVPTKVSDLINDTGFITNTVDNLVNYYLKTEQYTKEEINELISKIPKFDIEVVDDPNTIPDEERSETTIYLVPRTDGEHNDYYDEIIWIHNTWERLGSTKINLNNYYTKTDVDKLFLSKTDANSTFAKIRDIPDVSNFATKDEIPTDYAKLSDIKTKTSELINDSGFIDKDVNNLTQYYTIAETSQLILDNIPTQLAQLATDEDNQRVSVADKTKWNNKSDALLYDTTGLATDGAMTQKATTEYVSKQHNLAIEHANGAFEQIETLNKELTSLEETVASLAGSTDLSDRVGVLEENYSLLDVAFNEKVDEFETRIYAIEEDYVKFSEADDLPFVHQTGNVTESISGDKTFTGFIKSSQGKGVVTSNGNNIISHSNSANIHVGNTAMPTQINSSSRPKIYKDATNYEQMAYLTDIPIIPTIPDTSNMVTTNTTQTIEGAKTFSGTIIVPDVTIS